MFLPKKGSYSFSVKHPNFYYVYYFQRQPLADQNGTLSSSLRGPSKLPQAGSRLPQPGSRLPTPASKLKPPTNSSKRSRSPEQVGTHIYDFVSDVIKAFCVVQCYASGVTGHLQIEEDMFHFLNLLNQKMSLNMK